MTAQWRTMQDGQHILKLGGGILEISIMEFSENYTHTDTMLEVRGLEDPPLEKWAEATTLDGAKREALEWAKELLYGLVDEVNNALDNANKETSNPAFSPEA